VLLLIRDRQSTSSVLTSGADGPDLRPQSPPGHRACDDGRATRLEDRPAAAERRKPSAANHLLHAVWPRSGTARAASSTQRGAQRHSPPVSLFHGLRRGHKVLGSHADDAAGPERRSCQGKQPCCGRSLLEARSVWPISRFMRWRWLFVVIRAARNVASKCLSPRTLRLSTIMIATVAVLMAAHVCEIAVWSLAYALVQATPEGADQLYFAFVNFTTRGYVTSFPLRVGVYLGR
jgi:hypothetical protein